MCVCIYSGLIRGAIAFALSLQIDTPNSKAITSIVLLMVLLTMIILGSLMGIFFRKLNLKPLISAPVSLYDQIIR